MQIVWSLFVGIESVRKDIPWIILFHVRHNEHLSCIWIKESTDEPSALGIGLLFKFCSETHHAKLGGLRDVVRDSRLVWHGEVRCRNSDGVCGVRSGFTDDQHRTLAFLKDAENKGPDIPRYLLVMQLSSPVIQDAFRPCGIRMIENSTTGFFDGLFHIVFSTVFSTVFSIVVI